MDKVDYIVVECC